MKYLKYLIVILVITGCEDIIEVEDISNKTVTVLAPTNSVVLNNTTITFTWESVSEANAYTIQIATPNFENAQQILLDSTVSTTSYTKLLDYNTYEWRVRAKNSEYNTLYTTQNFTVEE